MKSFIFAFLKTFDPMSLPSITHPLRDFSIFFTIFLCSMFINFLIFGKVAIREVFLLINSVLKLICFLCEIDFKDFKKEFKSFLLLISILFFKINKDNRLYNKPVSRW